MTREEAIERYDRIRYNLLNREDKAAVDVAFDALMEQPRWISVEERLPEDRDWVLVWHTGYLTAKKAKYKDNDFPIWIIDGYGDQPGEVTHWMPLPEPPEVET